MCIGFIFARSVYAREQFEEADITKERGRKIDMCTVDMKK